MDSNEMIGKILTLKDELKKYITDTPHWLVYWIANREVKDFIQEYPNEYEDRVSLEVDHLDEVPSIRIIFDGHPDEIEYISRFCYLSNFRDVVEKNWKEMDNNIKEYRIKELQHDLEYHQRQAQKIQEEIDSIK